MPKNVVVEEGKFIGGMPWKKYLKITHKGKTYDTKTLYCWDDPDYPHPSDEIKAMGGAEKAGDSKKNWVDYLDFSDAEFSFKCSGFMKYDKSVDCLPKAPLGRIPVKDLRVCKKE